MTELIERIVLKTYDRVPGIQFLISSCEQCKPDFISFKNANREIKRNEKYFNWRYLEKPVELKGKIIWAMSDTGQKIGVLSVTPHFYYINDQRVPLGILGDISVDKQWRGIGMAREMFRFICEADELKQYAGFVVMPNEQASRPLEKAGWKTVLKVQRYVKIIDIEDRVFRWVKSRGISKLLSLPVNALLRAISFETYLSEEANYECQVVSEIDERFDELWNNFDHKEKCIGVRNKDYLNWRYLRHPIVKYHIFTLKLSKLCGYVIFHLNGKSCQIDDLLCVNDVQTPIYLMSYFLKYVREKRIASTVSISISPNNISYGLLSRYQFFKRSDYMKFMVKVNHETEKEGLFQNDDNWYLTSGDKEV